MDRGGSLPPELLASVLGWADPRDVIASRMVCRFWSAVVKHSAELQYMIELWRDGLLRGDNGQSTSVECMNRLSTRRTAWHNLQWSAQLTVQMQSLRKCQTYELVDGLLALRDQQVDKLYILPLPSGPRPANQPYIRSTGITPFNFQNFTIDLGQDLLVILHRLTSLPDSSTSWALDVRQLSYPNRRHPRAALKTLPFSPVSPFEAPPNRPHITLQILDDVVAIWFMHTCRLSLVNWVKSTLMRSFAFHQDPLYSELIVLECFMLDPHSFLLICQNEPGLPHHNGGSIRLYQMSDDDQVVAHVAIFALPPVARLSGALPRHTQTMAGPFRKQHTPASPHLQSNDRRIISLVVWYRPLDEVPNAGSKFGIRLVIHIRTFTQVLAEPETERPLVVKAWDEWGPNQTRIFHASEMDGSWARHIHGEKMIFATADTTHLPLLYTGFCLLDFNPAYEDASHGVSELQIRVTTPDGYEKGHWDLSGRFHPSRVTRGITVGLFEHRLRSTLPYREIHNCIVPPEGDPQPEYDVLPVGYGINRRPRRLAAAPVPPPLRYSRPSVTGCRPRVVDCRLKYFIDCRLRS
ncbi:F-box domain-containing protein [Mycena indigotica]|uniref:F-box domain-containing protein n=1 Tax=Mycena indigotica TaxID=2126181 RepID=A0A8H6VZ81_9AGAR|nr:F-box domain-containing protein [Mycena indigotica]KAF7295713.1 F-box domain-containing protein [Mycena indigotica]